MTGGYVDQEDLDKLMKNPTEETAMECMLSQLRYWFSVGPEGYGSRKTPEVFIGELMQKHKRVRTIKNKYGF